MQTNSKARSHVWLSKAQYEMLAAFWYQLRQFLHFSEQAARNAGLTPQQHQALLAIKGFPNRKSITIGELAEQLQIAQHSAVGLVDRSVEQNLIVREQSIQDPPVCLHQINRPRRENSEATHRSSSRRDPPSQSKLRIAFKEPDAELRMIGSFASGRPSAATDLQSYLTERQMLNASQHNFLLY